MLALDTLTAVQIRALELSEMAAWGDFYRAAPSEAARALGIRVGESGGSLVTGVSSADVLALNRVLGLGLEGLAEGKNIDDLVSYYAAAGVPRFFVQLSPAALKSELPTLLEDRGFRHHNNWVKLRRDAAPPPVTETDLEVSLIDGTGAQDFAEIVTTCFQWPKGVRDWVAGMIGRPGWRHYMAFDGVKPVATAALFVWRDMAWLDFAATLADYRGRGAQSGLLARRISDAASLGCSELVVETAEETPQRGAPSYCNVLRFGFQLAYTRPNYIYHLEGE
jgi:GNAT superfamily N-acetyltransferase